jgi:hypothetical protein
MLPLCADQHIAVMPWSPPARGRLTRGWNETGSRQETSSKDAVAALSLKLTTDEVAALERPYVPHGMAAF